MEKKQEELDENPENRNGDQVQESNEINTNSETRLMKLEEIAENKKNYEYILKLATDKLETFKEILNDQNECLKELQERNNNDSLKIKYENQCRDKMIKLIIETYDKLKTVRTSTNFVKNTIEICENNQEEINERKKELLDRICFNKEKDDLAYEQLIYQDNLLIKAIENEKLDMMKFEKEFQVKLAEANNKISSKKQNINRLKMKINKLKIKNALTEKKNMTVVSDANLISKDIDVVNFKINTLQIASRKERMKYVEKIETLKGSIEIENNYINNLEKTTDVIKQEIKNEKEVLDKMKYKKSELNQKLSNIKLKRNACNEKNRKLKEMLELETKEYNSKIAALKQEINEKQKGIIEMKNKNSILKKDHHELRANQIMPLKSNINQFELNIIKLNEELKEKKLLINENEKNFENTVTKLKATRLQEKDFNRNIKNEVKVLEKQISKLNIEKENEKSNYNNIFNEAATKEINLNLEIDKLNETKLMLENERQEAQTKLKKVMLKMDEDTKRAQQENDIKIKNLEEQTNTYKKEIERVHQANEEKYKEKREKLKEIEINLQMKIFECQINKKNLEEELAERIKELGKIREIKKIELMKKREDEFIEEAEREMANAMLKEKQVANEKKSKLNNRQELPNLEIPVSKYSSTSTSDNAGATVPKKKLQKQKRPRQSLAAKMFYDSEKKLDEIFNSFRDEPKTAEVTTPKKPKTKGAHKSRKT